MTLDAEKPPLTPPAPPTAQHGAGFAAVVALMDRLLAPDGCPWDQEQTLKTLQPFLIEEAYEVLEALERDAVSDGEAHSAAVAEHCEELGDLLFQIVFQAALRAREGAFGIDDVCAELVAKMTRRHPHVFGDTQVRDADEALKNWGRLKKEEHARAGKQRRTLEGIPAALPALSRARQLGERAAGVGFDWPDVQGVRAKVAEELAELDEAMAADTTTPAGQAAVEHEIGDVLFTLTRLSAWLRVDPEGALRAANARFERRFGAVEDHIAADGKDLKNMKLEAVEVYWQQVKKEFAGGQVPKK